MRPTFHTMLAAACSGLCIATTALASPGALDSVSPGLGPLGMWWASLLQALLR